MKKYLCANFGSMRIENNFSLLKYNTFGMDVSCRVFFEYETVGELVKFIESETFKKNTQKFHIGGGSNLLFSENYDGLVMHSNIKGIEIVKETLENCIVRVGSGVIWDDFVAWCVECQSGGAENLSLIPGEVGASPVQNIGAYGAEAKDIIVSVETISMKDASSRIFENEECGFSYRNSIFKKESDRIVTFVNFKLIKTPFYNYNLTYTPLREAFSQRSAVSLKAVREAVIAIRNKKLPNPAQCGNAGSFFKNPLIHIDLYRQLQKKYPDMPCFETDEEKVKIPAGWLVEQTGWRGKTYKQAGVYEKQALVLINRGGASGKDILELARKIEKSVFKKFGITIEPEVIVVG